MTPTTHAPLDADALDAYARRYYLVQDDVPDLHVEDLQQVHSADLIADAVAGAGRVIELGYGVGLMTRELRDRGVPIEVLEGSPLLAAAAREAHPDLVVHEGLFESFVPDEPVDAVLALHVVEHVDDPRTLLAHLATWLRPGGRLVVVVPNAESLHRRLAVRMGLQPALDILSPRDHLVGHQRVYTLDGLAADVTSTGLRPVSELGWFLKTLPNSMMLDWPRELLIALNQISDELEPRQLANIGLVAERPR
ncbi:methyltransferase domain-containing protein [Conexibacter sp. W3-3-2]|uniref:class I SAM-dependent methyltransferase n=1 Tax=Conexibacter sp. W3-3-2 TaxID=2675227 RepID=UPI0012B8ADAD|nr:class I SAM-dependent methyltransferase [Conexibacter sp. W3-3-2]MTD45420.1 methyltransferase domain-containing protein [Conexibacter sp. W3-3-2]